MNEKINDIIDKLVIFKIKHSELSEIASHIETEDFINQYLFTENISLSVQEAGRMQARKDIMKLIKEEKKEGRLTKIINIKEYRLHAVAACVFFTCSAGIIKKTTGYNKESNFRKTYLIQNERK